jgi:excisionase family DNA binding protein
VEKPARDIESILDTLAESAASKISARIQAPTRSLAIQPRLLTVEQAAIYIGRSRRGVEHLISSQELPTVRHDRRVFLDVRDLDAWIESTKS